MRSDRTEIAVLFRYEKAEELWPSSLYPHHPPLFHLPQGRAFLWTWKQDGHRCLWGFLQQVGFLENNTEERKTLKVLMASREFSGKNAF